MTMINTDFWQLSTPIDAIIFDCDGTLTELEGVDELARGNHVYDAVSALTANAMSRAGINISLYQKRLDLIKPTQEQVLSVGNDYYKKLNPDTQAVIQLLQQQKKAVFIVSAGLYPSVRALGEQLAIPDKNIFAVNIEFDAQGRYLHFDHQSPLVTQKGKRNIVAEIKKKYPRLVYVGDGLNDFSAYSLVTRFIGYGGAFYRERIADMCEYYIKTPSMSPLIPLIFTKDELKQLRGSDIDLLQKGLHGLQQGDVLIQAVDQHFLKNRFEELGLD